jgi:hypothetical protein
MVGQNMEDFFNFLKSFIKKNKVSYSLTQDALIIQIIHTFTIHDDISSSIKITIELEKKEDELDNKAILFIMKTYKEELKIEVNSRCNFIY